MWKENAEARTNKRLMVPVMLEESVATVSSGELSAKRAKTHDKT